MFYCPIRLMGPGFGKAGSGPNCHLVCMRRRKKINNEQKQRPTGREEKAGETRSLGETVLKVKPPQNGLCAPFPTCSCPPTHGCLLGGPGTCSQALWLHCACGCRVACLRCPRRRGQNGQSQPHEATTPSDSLGLPHTRGPVQSLTGLGSTFSGCKDEDMEGRETERASKEGNTHTYTVDGPAL